MPVLYNRNLNCRISDLHNSLNIQPNPVLIRHVTDEIFAHCPSRPNPLVQQIYNYTLADLANFYKKNVNINVRAAPSGRTV